MIMKVLSVACCLLAARVSAAPAAATAPASPVLTNGGNINDTISQSTLLHTANHDVTCLGVLFGEDKEIEDKVVFFIESDVNKQGERVDYGLHALTKDPTHPNHTVSTKLLDNARDIAVASLTETAYFAAKDGIYVYNKKKNSAEKFGSVSDEVISIAAENATGVLYYVNKQHQLYKVTERGQKATIVDVVKNADQITVDYKGHLYYYTVDKKFYVYDGQNAKLVEGVPSNRNKVSFLRTPVLVGDYGVVNVDGDYYVIYGADASGHAASGGGAGGRSAVSVESGLVLYFSVDRKIYELNIIEKVVEGMMEGLSRGLKTMMEEMRNTFNSFDF
ncbi:uncharacterized protein LOC134748730 [Cydia strobilella]|uniref:uncharacterized protein LOC134748730 n=1 Tax=Cydia strobilella TaxID=1100964 RepID=UPI003005D09C